MPFSARGSSQQGCTRPASPAQHDGMSIEIDILNGAAALPLAEPLLRAAWPGAAHGPADFRVLLEDDSDGVIAHVAILRRKAVLDGRPVHVGGLGGLTTRADLRRRGHATLALNAALQTLKHEGSLGFALLFAPADLVPFFAARGWHAFEGEVLATGADGLSLSPLVHDLVLRPRRGRLDLQGPRW
jgi:GNAT superfamily N-acetyltransferase